MNEIKKILTQLSPYKSTIVLVIITGILTGVAQTATLKFLKDLVDTMSQVPESGQVSMNSIYYYVSIILGLALFASINRYLHFFSMNMISEKVCIGLRRKIQERFLRLNLSFHNSYATGSGGLLSRVTNDVVTIQHGLRLVADLFREPILFVLMIGTLFYIDWKLTLSIIFILPLISLFLKQLARSLRKYGQASQEILEKITNTIKESLEGVRVIQSFNLETEMEDRFKKEAQEYLETRRKVHSRTEIASPVTEFIVTALFIGLIVYMGLEISSGGYTLGDFTWYTGALLSLQKPVKKLQESFVKVQETLVAIKRTFAIIENNSIVPENPSPIPFPENWQTIEFKDISFSYGEKKVLDRFSLTVERGKKIALVGSSGSGKSTVVNLLKRFYDSTQGDILIDGISIKNFSLPVLREKIALVSQDVFLFNQSIAYNIQSGNFEKSESDILNAAQLANASKFIEESENKYDTIVGERGNRLSGGEKQRISIARAILKNAPILILDEATSALDSASEADVQEGLDHLMENKTAFIVAHRLSTIAHADQIVVLDQGRIVEQGTHSELLQKKGTYFRFSQLQQQEAIPLPSS